MNFHGARNKTRTVENRSKKQDIAPKNHGNDVSWGPVPKSSGGASNWDDGWGDIPQKSSTSDNAWGQDRLVHGKAEKNRKFRSNNTNSTFRVPNQSQPNWNEVDEKFPALGGRATPTVNVWEKRKEKFDQVKAIEPTNQTEEEMMIQKAIELSKMEISHEEEKRRQLEEEYRLQTELLEANPDMFEEFRLGEETYKSAAEKFVAESYAASNGFSEKFSSNRISKDSVQHVNGWDKTNEITLKNNDLKKEKKDYESPKEEDGTSQLKQDSWLQPSNNAAGKSHSGARPKISKVVDMFGGWGTTKPAATASHRDNVEDGSGRRSSKWDTVDVEFARRSSVQKPVTVKPINSLSSPDLPEDKINNMFSNWDTAGAKTATKLSGWDNDEAETANKLSTLDINETKTVTKTSTWDTVETIDANLENASLRATPEIRNCKVPYVKSDQQEDIIKVTSKDENWGSDSLEGENSFKTSDNFELNSENSEHGYASYRNDKKLVPQSEQKNSKSKADFKTQSKGKSLLSERDTKKGPLCFGKEVISDLDNDQNIEMNKHEFQSHRSEQSHGICPEISAIHADAKAKIDSLEGKCFDSYSSVESDYSFFLNSIDPNYKSSTTESKIPNQDIKVPTVTSFPITEHKLEFPQMVNQTPSPFVLPEDNPCENPPIPGPHPLYTDYNEAPSTFGAFPGQIDSSHLSLSRNNVSLIDPPKAAVPTPELINPVFPPQPMMTPLMNPSLMMGMNPMLMQQMMMLSNPFFMQQWQQMAMYYKSLGMSLEGGMPFYPQTTPLPNFANNPNAHVFGNLRENVGPIPATEDGMISPPFPAASSPPGINASHLSTRDSPEVDQPDDNFWFESYVSSDSSLIPPPKPTPVSAQENLPGVTPDSKISPTASLPIGATSMCDEGLSPFPGHQSYEDSSRSPEVPYVTGWGDINDCNSNEASGWCDDVDGWGSESASTARSMRNPSRHIAEKKTACRQPASRPYLGRAKQ